MNSQNSQSTGRADIFTSLQVNLFLEEGELGERPGGGEERPGRVVHSGAVQAERWAGLDCSVWGKDH